MKSDPKERFSRRVAYYDMYRPRYPDTILEFMKCELGLTVSRTVADIGSGTGILSEMFLKNGNTVFGVEPNKEMREAAKSSLAAYPNFRSIDGSAESTTLPADSADFITAAQAFHWFDRTKAKEEFLRVLRPQGWVVLVWNTRRKSTAFLREYERLVQDYSGEHRVKHEDLDGRTFAAFLGAYRARRFDNFQLLGHEGLLGRLLSASYAPLPGNSAYESMLAEVRRIFDTFQTGGRVRIEYDTEVYCGQLR